MKFRLHIPVVLFFTLCFSLHGRAQNGYDIKLLLKTWKLQGFIYDYNGVDSITPQKEIDNEFITFKADSISEGVLGADTSEGKWYFNSDGRLVSKSIKINGELNPLRDREFLAEIKELTSERLVIVCLGRENKTACLYTSVTEHKSK